MDKVQQSPHKSQSNQQDNNALPSQEEFQTSSMDLISADGPSTQYTPKRMMMLQRTLGNQATMQVINRKTPKTTLPSGFAQRSSVIQRDEKDGGNSAPVQDDQGQEQQEEQVEDPQSDPEVAEQDAELDTIPPEAAEVEAIVSSAQGGDGDNTQQEQQSQGGDDSQQQDQGQDAADDQGQTVFHGQVGPAAPSSGATVSTSVDDGPDDDDSGASYQAQPATTTIKKDKKAKGNSHYTPNRLGGGNIVTGVIQSGVAASKAAEIGIDTTTAAYLIKEGSWIKSSTPNSVDVASDDSASSVLDRMSSVGEYLNAPPLNIILPVPTLLQRAYLAYMKYKHFKAFKDLADAAGGIDKASLKQKGGGADRQKISTYGYYKTRRGLWSRVAKAIMSLGQIVARVVTIASGLTAGMVSEGVDLALALSQSVMKLSESIKGLIKIILNKRGKHRAMVANRIVDIALSGDQDMLKFMVNSEALSKTWFAKISAGTKSGVANYFAGLGVDITKLPMVDQVALTMRPKNEAEMLDYLKLCERLGVLQALSVEVSSVMKST
jgi:hypothetical protein